MEKSAKISARLVVKGIKCDSCSYKDDNVEFEDYLEWLNKPCPICGENPLTADDFNKMNKNSPSSKFDRI